MKLIYNAVFRAEVQDFLHRAGLSAAIEKGSLFCASCGKMLTNQNIGVITRLKGRLLLLCNSPECVVPERTEETKKEE